MKQHRRLTYWIKSNVFAILFENPSFSYLSKKRVSNPLSCCVQHFSIVLCATHLTGIRCNIARNLQVIDIARISFTWRKWVCLQYCCEVENDPTSATLPASQCSTALHFLTELLGLQQCHITKFVPAREVIRAIFTLQLAVQQSFVSSWTDFSLFSWAAFITYDGGMGEIYEG